MRHYCTSASLRMAYRPPPGIPGYFEVCLEKSSDKPSSDVFTTFSCSGSSALENSAISIPKLQGQVFNFSQFTSGDEITRKPSRMLHQIRPPAPFVNSDLFTAWSGSVNPAPVWQSVCWAARGGKKNKQKKKNKKKKTQLATECSSILWCAKSLWNSGGVPAEIFPNQGEGTSISL